jgi:hypothetical protein
MIKSSTSGLFSLQVVTKDEEMSHQICQMGVVDFTKGKSEYIFIFFTLIVFLY